MTQTDNHWVNEGTVLEAIKRIDEQINPIVVIERYTWLLVWDVCPVHISKSTRSRLIEEFPHVKTVFVNANFTGTSQPADVAFFSPLKAFIRRLACEDLCNIILAKIDDAKPLAETIKTTVLKKKIVSWVQGGMQELQKKEKLFEKAWRELLVKDDDRLDVEYEAEQQHLAGKLFRRAGRNKIVPENAPDQEEQ